MAIHGERFRPPLLQTYSYPSLPGLEIAVPPEPASSSTDIMAYYMHKALPPPPPVRTPDTSSGQHSDSVSVKKSKTKRISVLAVAKNAHAVNGSPRNFEQLPGHVLNTDSKRMEEKQTPGDDPQIS